MSDKVISLNSIREKKEKTEEDTVTQLLETAKGKLQHFYSEQEIQNKLSQIYKEDNNEIVLKDMIDVTIFTRYLLEHCDTIKYISFGQCISRSSIFFKLKIYLQDSTCYHNGKNVLFPSDEFIQSMSIHLNENGIDVPMYVTKDMLEDK